MRSILIRKIVSSKITTASFLASVLLIGNAFCQDPQKSEEDIEKKFPKTGVIAATKQSGRNAEVGGFGNVSYSEDDQAPITGSVSRLNQTKWVAKVFNNSKKSISASFTVKQMNAAGNQIDSDSFSVTLGPGQSNERPITASASTVNAELAITNWKILKEKEGTGENSTKEPVKQVK